jgi:hypothetical protein
MVIRHWTLEYLAFVSDSSPDVVTKPVEAEPQADPRVVAGASVPHPGTGIPSVVNARKVSGRV